MHVIIWPLALMGILGGIFGAVLAVASVMLAVKQDERITLIRASLPGANCGACGYPGCDGFADGVVNEGAKTNGCVVGGSAVAARVAEIMGVSAEESVPMKAFVKCLGSPEKSPRKTIYSGIEDCASAAVLPGGSPNSCPFGCIGFGTCAKVCSFGAITMKDGLPSIDVSKCEGCGACAGACPKGVISILPKKADIIVACNSHWKGAMVRPVCTAGCIGCGMCVKACPAEAITLDRDLAVIDQDKCIACGRCAGKCPVKCIKTAQACRPEMTA